MLDAVRVLPGVRAAAFDIPTETFTIALAPGTELAPVQAAIRELGYEPEVLPEKPAARAATTHVAAPTSAALRDALARAQARGVPLVLEFGGPFCSLCRKLERTTLADARVKARLAQAEFLAVDVEDDPAAAKDLGVKGVPDLWVLDGDGRVRARENRYLDAEAFLALLARGGVAEAGPVDIGRALLRALRPGPPPAGFTVASGAWQVLAAEGDAAPRLMQTAKGEGPAFNVLLLPADLVAQDLEIEVLVTPVDGDVDRGGGPVWRAQGGQDYYVARWNPLETNFRLYKVVAGRRTQLASADVPAGHAPRTLRVRMRGSEITGWLDGQERLRATDTTFPDAGRVGLWTKADARTVFGPLSVRRSR